MIPFLPNFLDIDHPQRICTSISFCPSFLPSSGLDHLLPNGRGAGGREGEEAEELKIACFMGLLSYLASVPEVLRISTFHTSKILNAVAKAISQSATLTDTPLTDSGLDGTGEVIQVRQRL